MRVLFFGVYDPNYARNWVLINGLRKRLIIHNEDMSKIILAIERLKENKINN